MIDGLDGFQLAPSQAAMSRPRIVVIALVASATLVILLLAVLAVAMKQPMWWAMIAVYLVLSVPGDWLVWRSLQPAVLRADGTTISDKSRFLTVTVPRSEVAGIRVAQASSSKSYVFATATGRVLLTVPAMYFDMAEIRSLGQRLNVPVSERP